MVKKRRLKIKGGQFVYSAELPPSEEKEIWKRLDLQPNKRIREIYKDGYVNIGDEKIKLTSAISPAEGFHLYDLIKNNKYKNILEVGMANGLSGMYMLQALADNGGEGKLTSLDPFQTTQWKSSGLHNVKEAGLADRHVLIQKKSYDAMPELLAKGKKYDMIFIDGMHLFDYTLVDMFYAILLCDKGGAIVIDDILHKAPAKVVRYIDTNYKFLRRVLPSPVKTMATYVKNNDDSRAWDFHQSF
jgi:predicted O-methyltransferase YrrM